MVDKTGRSGPPRTPPLPSPGTQPKKLVAGHGPDRKADVLFDRYLRSGRAPVIPGADASHSEILRYARDEKHSEDARGNRLLSAAGAIDLSAPSPGDRQFLVDAIAIARGFAKGHYENQLELKLRQFDAK